MHSVQDIYRKLNITPPNIPYTEKIRQVMAWYPNKKFYKVRSAKSGKDIISVYPDDATMPLMSHSEWFAQDFPIPEGEIDVHAPFFPQFHELQKVTPLVALLSSQHENSEYCHDVEGIKNSYICFDSVNCENNYYCVRIFDSKNCVDCYIVNRSELLYECVHVDDSYNTKWSFFCKNVSESAFLFNCRNVKNSFMCSNLRNKEYCVYNEQKTKEEYEAFMNNIDTSNYALMQQYRDAFRTLIKKTPIPPAFNELCEEATGSHLRNVKQSENLFEAYDIKNSYNAFQVWKGSDIADGFMMGLDGELIYQSVATGVGIYWAICCVYVWHSSYMEYCFQCFDCKECFGCIGLKNRSFCILNKQYTEAEYRIKKAELIAKMKERGEYACFFPEEYSPFHYEDTIAYDFFAHPDRDTFAEEKNAAKSVAFFDKNATQQCPLTHTPFRYTPQESHYYEVQKLPFPRISFAKRHSQRLEMMDTGFVPKTVHSTLSQSALTTYYAHPEKWNIVTETEYQNSLN